jgi:hypothetical protein
MGLPISAPGQASDKDCAVAMVAASIANRKMLILSEIGHRICCPILRPAVRFGNSTLVTYK